MGTEMVREHGAHHGSRYRLAHMSVLTLQISGGKGTTGVTSGTTGSSYCGKKSIPHTT